MHASLIGVASLAALAFPASAQEVDNDFPFVRYVEVPGETEFTGVLCARPLQVEDAAELGLSTSEVRRRAQAAREALAGYAIEKVVVETDEYLFRVPAGETENTVANTLLATGNFAYVEPDWRVFPIGCPNDGLFSNQWHHQSNRMQSCDAWDTETGDPSIVVALCDTGLRTSHEDVQLHRREGFHAPSNTWEFSGGPINDIQGHGTLVTGTAAANGDNAAGVSGVGWNLGHRMMRVTDDTSGSASLSNLTLAARTAADAGDKVASVSYSGVQSSSVDTTGSYVRSQGALLVWAAGNSANNMSGSRDDNVVVVGATTSSDSLASFSNFGSFVDFTAPGAGIWTTSRNNDSSYSSVSGTSFSCPMTAGLAGLIWSRNPDLTPQEVEDILRNSCDDLGAAGVDNTYGYGRINAFEAIQLTPSPTVSISYPNGRPETLDPDGGETLDVLVEPGNDAPVTAAAEFWVDTGSGFQPGAISYLGNDLFEATFPAASCPSDVSYYFVFPLVGGGTASSPTNAPSSVFAATAISSATLLSDELEVDSGWIAGVAGDDATTGVWTRVDPVGTAAQPEDDHTVAGTDCFVTGQGIPGGGLGDNDVDGGTTTLVSPIYDLSTHTDPYVGYWRWYSNSTGASPNADVFVVDVSDDGGATWTNVETVGPAGVGTSGGWIRHTFRVADLVGVTSQIRLRFVASDLGSGSLVEAGVDDLEVFDLCPDACGVENYCTATVNSTGSPASIGAAGSASFAANDLVLTAWNCPPNSIGLFAYSPDRTQTPLGNGNLCLGSQTLGFNIRLAIESIDFIGNASHAFDNLNPPIPQGQVAAGETWNFQFIFRDNAAGGALFNLTDGLSVTFCP